MNWKELKNFCNNLTELELEKQVVLWREDAEEVITAIAAEQIDEDQYILEDDPQDGCFPLSEAQTFIKNDPDSYPDGMAHFKKVHEKGFPVLSEVF